MHVLTRDHLWANQEVILENDEQCKKWWFDEFRVQWPDRLQKCWCCKIIGKRRWTILRNPLVDQLPIAQIINTRVSTYKNNVNWLLPQGQTAMQSRSFQVTFQNFQLPLSPSKCCLWWNIGPTMLSIRASCLNPLTIVGLLLAVFPY